MLSSIPILVATKLMCIKIAANGFGSGKGTHLSLFVGITRGEYDDKVQWPFQEKLTIQCALRKVGNMVVMS